MCILVGCITIRNCNRIAKCYKYYTLVISGMRFLIVSDMGFCNIYQVFDGPDETSETIETDGDDKEYKLTVEYRNGQRYCYLSVISGVLNDWRANYKLRSE